jgi:hypothetical protein
VEERDEDLAHLQASCLLPCGQSVACPFAALERGVLEVPGTEKQDLEGHDGQVALVRSLEVGGSCTFAAALALVVLQAGRSLVEPEGSGQIPTFVALPQH